MAETERVNSLKQASWVAPKKWSALWRFLAGRQLLNALFLRKGVCLLLFYTKRTGMHLFRHVSIIYTYRQEAHQSIIS